MKHELKNKRRCDSWYHHRWFRILLLLVGIDMFILGFVFALGYNPLVFFVAITGPFLRALIGIAYVVVSGYIIKHSLSYSKMVSERHLVCEDCLYGHDKDTQQNQEEE